MLVNSPGHCNAPSKIERKDRALAEQLRKRRNALLWPLIITRSESLRPASSVVLNIGESARSQ